MESTETAKARLAAIEHYAVLERPVDRDLQSLVDLAAQIFAVPSAAISVLTADQQHSIATAGFDPGVCTRNDSMCAVLLGDPDTVVVPDASVDPRFARNPFVTGPLGSVRFYATAPLLTPEGVQIGRLCVFDNGPRDFSEQQRTCLAVLADRVMDVLELHARGRQLEESLQELTDARDELRRSNEHLTLFAGQVSHDLRTPLTAIMANAEMMAGEPAVAESEDLVWMVGGIARAAHRMNTMIEEMLDYAQVGGRLSVVPTDLGALCEVVLDDLAPVVGSTGAEVTVGPLPTLPADRNQVYAVLLNLLSNALKFVCPGRPPRIHVSAGSEDGYWRVSVTDNGIGVPADRRESMFVLFTRADKRIDGSGIGLATTKRIVEAHGGRVGMESAAEDEPGAGTTVWFELPA